MAVKELKLTSKCPVTLLTSKIKVLLIADGGGRGMVGDESEMLLLEGTVVEVVDELSKRLLGGEFTVGLKATPSSVFKLFATAMEEIGEPFDIYFL